MSTLMIQTFSSSIRPKWYGDRPCRWGLAPGGDWASSVPVWCRIDCRISIYPGWNAEDASREIQQRIMKFARSDKFLSNIPPTVTKRNGDRIQVFVARDVDFRSVYELRTVGTER